MAGDVRELALSSNTVIFYCVPCTWNCLPFRVAEASLRRILARALLVAQARIIIPETRNVLAFAMTCIDKSIPVAFGIVVTLDLTKQHVAIQLRIFRQTLEHVGIVDALIPFGTVFACAQGAFQAKVLVITHVKAAVPSAFSHGVASGLCIYVLTTLGVAGVIASIAHPCTVRSKNAVFLVRPPVARNLGSSIETLLGISIVAALVLLTLKCRSEAVAGDVCIVVWFEAKVIVVIPFAATKFMETLVVKNRSRALAG